MCVILCSRGLYKSYFRVLELKKGSKRGPIERVNERAPKKWSVTDTGPEDLGPLASAI